jgi:hypothetical protein
MRTAKRRNVKNRTVKGGLSDHNTKVHLIVRKSKLDRYNEKLIYDLVIAKPSFPFITDYIWNSMNAVDEALALVRMKEVPVKDALGNVVKSQPDVVYKDTFEYGYNEIYDDDDKVNMQKTEEEEKEEEEISNMYKNNIKKIYEKESAKKQVPGSKKPSRLEDTRREVQQKIRENEERIAKQMKAKPGQLQNK